MAYDLAVGKFDLNDADKDKSTGFLYPASQLIINKKGELQFELRKNPWKLVNIIDWNKAGSEAPPQAVDSLALSTLGRAQSVDPMNRRFQLLLRRSASSRLHSGDRLVLKDADHDAAVL